MKRFIVFVVLFVAVSVTSCGKYFKQEVEEQPAQSLAITAMEYYEKEKYKKAIQYFEKINDWYPFSKYAILAELKIADSHYNMEAYEEASYAYRQFESLHPKNEAIPYVIYQDAMCDYNRMDTIDRDQGSTLRALETFERLNAKFPDHELREEVDEKIIECHTLIAGNYFYIAKFYYKNKDYLAALNRFNMIVDEYDDSEVYQEALEYVELCKAKLKQQVKDKGIMGTL